jgi:hypothetical protein
MYQSLLCTLLSLLDRMAATDAKHGERLRLENYVGGGGRGEATHIACRCARQPPRSLHAWRRCRLLGRTHVTRMAPTAVRGAGPRGLILLPHPLVPCCRRTWWGRYALYCAT